MTAGGGGSQVRWVADTGAGLIQSVSPALWPELRAWDWVGARDVTPMRRGGHIPAWHLPLVAVLGILSGCQSLRDLARFARRHHVALTPADA